MQKQVISANCRADLNAITDSQLLSMATALAKNERLVQAELLQYLSEIDRRRLYLPAFRSMFDYLTRGLKYSEASACKRIQVVRLGRIYPEIFMWVGEQRFTLSNLSLLAPVVKGEKGLEVLRSALGKSRRQCQDILALCGAPRPEPSDRVRAVLVSVSPVIDNRAGSVAIAAKAVEQRTTTSELKFPETIKSETAMPSVQVIRRIHVEFTAD